ncbi:GDP-L-fucose synthase [Stenotrophomonas maltophilia]|uniref:GDP-L-fucose synthase n=1 Tax=Stenotrophomonas maltophilia TaxID=40324 RepID=UPI0013DBFB1D|nr:GDP-L-fucose synthase [Stenotrophomonas maltophilia]
MNTESRIFVAGHRGLVGSAIVRRLESLGYTNILVAGRDVLDLRDRASVDAFFAKERPDVVFLAAAKVGGIHANSSYPADFLFENLQIQNNVIDSAYRSGSKKLIFLGSSCIYPKFAEQPISEDSLLTGQLEPTNEWYAVAKISGIKLCQAYRRQYGFNAISLMPTNLYGPGDNFDLNNSHVLPALMRKFHEAKLSGSPQVVMWGTGRPRREFLHVDDMASATVHLAETYSGEDIVNIGVGQDVSIGELAEIIKSVTGYEGEIVNDETKPDGTPRKLLDVRRLSALGWAAEVELEDGIRSTYKWFLENQGSLRSV